MQNVHFSPTELAKLFAVNVSTIKRWVDRGLLQSDKTPGGHRRISKEQLAAFIRDYPTLTRKSYTIKRLLAQKQFIGSKGVSDNEKNTWGVYYNYLLQDSLEEAERLIKEAF